MSAKKNRRVRRKNIQITIYPKTGRKMEKILAGKKDVS